MVAQIFPPPGYEPGSTACYLDVEFCITNNRSIKIHACLSHKVEVLVFMHSTIKLDYILYLYLFCNTGLRISNFLLELNGTPYSVHLKSPTVSLISNLSKSCFNKTTSGYKSY